ncbi:MAG: copper resistance protein NlpE N-terminal domain-containing protein [Chitinophaga sp.]|uniref:copper resistance protein NlpE n=1 Tax=Chitinophaga sp. TaxID=1869181 RepID=UPI001B1E97DA|nr:copper resistance protein NlpE [Chitinophaga sp.]MBO9728891.1 copper resistance protein NlpE N-terminal domain-containing protein [Chitinophaga sp.]
MKRLPLLLVCVIFAACQQTGKHIGGTDSTATQSTDADTAAQVTYTGTLPCADCEGIVTELTLHRKPETSFTMKETYLGKNQTFPSEGNYVVLHGTPSDPSATVIQLNPDKDKNLQRYFQQVNIDELKMLDIEQRVIESNHNYTLKKVL